MEENEKIDENGELEDEYGTILTLTDEEGVEHVFELVDTAEIEGVSYAALIAGPENPDLIDGDGDLIIMRACTDESGEEYLELIEDDDEFEQISDIFVERLSDLYEFEEVDIEEEDEEE